MYNYRVTNLNRALELFPIMAYIFSFNVGDLPSINFAGRLNPKYLIKHTTVPDKYKHTMYHAGT